MPRAANKERSSTQNPAPDGEYQVEVLLARLVFLYILLATVGVQEVAALHVESAYGRSLLRAELAQLKETRA